MEVEKFSHVIHLTSMVTGMLREGKNRCVIDRAFHLSVEAELSAASTRFVPSSLQALYQVRPK